MQLFRKLISRLKPASSCCQPKNNVSEGNLKKIVIIGSPNVGKSVMFNNLTQTYVVVSNYPGTTVHITRGNGKIGADKFEIIDTPGMYSLLPITEEERVARSILLEEHPAVVVHIIDAKNLERMLVLTLQLIEAKVPLILALNIIDEAEDIGMNIDTGHLEAKLGIPVVATVSTTGRGMDALRRKIEDYVREKS